MKTSLVRPAVLLAFSLGACVPGERITQPTPRGLARTPSAGAPATPADNDAALRAWQDAGARALRAGLALTPSVRERLRFPQAQPLAVAYRFDLRRGQRLDLRIDALDGSSPLHAEIFQVTEREYRPVHRAGGSGTSSFEAPHDAEYMVRLQPGIGAGGLYDVTVGTTGADGSGSLLFPVLGGGLAAVGSWYGDARDGGVRRHEGVDIMAPRGTPVLAVAHGYVQSVRSTPTGGLVVWLNDDRRGVSYYYAHLDRQLVREGSYVSAGDTIGTVGTTGNAQGSSPHLHFGIYRPGTIAIDPAPLLRGAAIQLTETALPDADAIGRWAQVSGSRVRLRAAPSLGAAVVTELGSATPLFVLGGVQGWHRVVLEDGTTGFIASEYTVGRGN